MEDEIDPAAAAREGKTYYIAELGAGVLTNAGISVVPQPNVPEGYDPAHAELPDLNAGIRKSTQTLERQRILVELCRKVQGPFPSSAGS